MYKKQVPVFLVLCMCKMMIFAQQNTVPLLKLSYQKNDSGDTVVFTINKSPRLNPGSIMLVAKPLNYQRSDTFFFPVIDTLNIFALVIPPVYQFKNILLKGYFYPGIFKVFGRVDRSKDEPINALIITDNQRIYNKAISLNKLKEFSLPPLVFEKSASLVFNYATGKMKEHPDVTIKQYPTVADFTDSIFSETIILKEPVNINPAKADPIVDTGAVFNDPNGITLQTVTVKGVKKSVAEKFNEENSTGVFNDASEKIIDCLSDDDILSYPDCLSFLRTKIPGIIVNVNKFGESIVKWRGHETKAFFIDEIPVDIEQILNMSVADIAIVKSYPPPFFGGAGNGDGGAIAIYTRKGEYTRPGTTVKKWIFSIRGYSNAMHVLFSGK